MGQTGPVFPKPLSCMRQANPNFAGYTSGVGDDTGTGTNGGVTPPRTTIDLSPVSFGAATFTNPCFWVIVGALGAVAIYYFMSHKRQ